MIYNYDNMKINYQIYGRGRPLILLHGWGLNYHTFDHLIDYLGDNYTIFAIDLPGFGQSEQPQNSYNLTQYVKFLELFITELQIEKPIIIGHSFGGRIAIKYVSSHNDLVNKLILVDSAGIKKRKTIKQMVSIIRYKCLKKYYKFKKDATKYNQLLKVNGSNDFINASNIMKGTMSKVIKEDLRKYLKKINVETLIIWGKDDKETPYKDALYMSKTIKTSGLVTFENCGHFPYLEKKKYFHIVIGKYLGVIK